MFIFIKRASMVTRTRLNVTLHLYCHFLFDVNENIPFTVVEFGVCYCNP